MFLGVDPRLDLRPITPIPFGARGYVVYALKGVGGCIVWLFYYFFEVGPLKPSSDSERPGFINLPSLFTPALKGEAFQL